MVTPVGLGLRVHLRVSVDLAGGSEEEPSPLGLGQTECVVGAQAPHLEYLDRNAVEIDRRSRTGEVHHRIDLARDPHVGAHVVLHEREAGPTEESFDVGERARDQVVEAHPLVAPIQKASAQVRAQEAGTPGDHHAGHG